MTKFPWFDQLAELSVECAPEGWEICSDYRNRWIYHRYDELFNADQYVEVMALVYPNSRKVLVEVHIRSELHKSEWGKGNSRKFSTMTFTPECRSDLADCIKQAYKEVDRLNPTL